MFAVYYSLNLSDVRFPCSVCLAVGMGNVVTECNALSADAALCHIIIPPSMESKNNSQQVLLYHIANQNARG